MPEKIVVISSFIAEHHFTSGIKESKDEAAEAVTFITKANHRALQLLAHVTIMCLRHFRPWVYAARYANTLPSLSSLLFTNYLKKLQLLVAGRTKNCW